MNCAAIIIPEDRELTPGEMELVRWLLEHGGEHAMTFLSQFADIRVVSRCSCGCASIDFAIAGARPSLRHAMDVLSEYQWRDSDGHLFGVFVFARDSLLAGLDLWSIDAQATAVQLPKSGELRPLEITRSN